MLSLSFGSEMLARYIKADSFLICVLMQVFWIVMSCGLLDAKQRFVGIYCLHLQGEKPTSISSPPRELKISHISHFSIHNNATTVNALLISKLNVIKSLADKNLILRHEHFCLLLLSSKVGSRLLKRYRYILKKTVNIKSSCERVVHLIAPE